MQTIPCQAPAWNLHLHQALRPRTPTPVPGSRSSSPKLDCSAATFRKYLDAALTGCQDWLDRWYQYLSIHRPPAAREAVQKDFSELQEGLRSISAWMLANQRHPDEPAWLTTYLRHMGAVACLGSAMATWEEAIRLTAELTVPIGRLTSHLADHPAGSTVPWPQYLPRFTTSMA